MRNRRVGWLAGAALLAGSSAPRAEEGAADPNLEEAVKRAAERLNAEFSAGRLDAALAAADELLDLQIRRKGRDDPNVALARFYRGAVLDRMPEGAAGDPREGARAEYEAALAILRGPARDPALESRVLNNLAANRIAAGDRPRARTLLAEAVDLARGRLEATGGAAERAGLARVLNNLADLERTLDELPSALVHAEEAVDAAERLPEGHPDRNRLVGLCAHTVGLVRDDLGQPDQAAILYARALDHKIEALGANAVEVASTRNVLGNCLLLEGRLDEAQPLLESAVEVLAARAPESDHLAAACNNLGLLHLRRGDLERAEPLLERSLALRERRADPEALARTLDSIGDLHLRRKDFEGAFREAERALEARKRAGAPAWRIVDSLDRLAGICQGLGRGREARAAWTEALDRAEGLARSRLRGLTERDALAASVSARKTLNRWLAFTTGDPSAVGYERVLALKAVVARRTRLERADWRRSDASTRETLRELEREDRRRTALLNRPRPEEESALRAWRAAIAESEKRRESLARALATVARDRGTDDATGIPEVQRAMGPGAALVDFLRHEGGYSAWLLRPEGPARRYDLGPAEAIDRAVEAFRRALRDAPSARDRVFLETGSALAALVWGPLAPDVGTADRLFVVPDGALAAIPFAALPAGEPGRFLIDRFVLAFLGAAQDLLPADPEGAGEGILLLGGVDYGTGGAGTFAPLDGAASEIDGIARLLPAAREGEVARLAGAEATEEAVRRLAPGRAILHFATHGMVRRERGSGGAAAPPLPPSLEQTLARPDPMALAFLALRGANAGEGGGDDDGLLTAAEAARLDLSSTRLVVLSACETALGDPRAGEGVLGLVRGFHSAGARAVVASFWKVDDEASALWMRDFYARLLAAADPAPASALREVALAWKSGAGAFADGGKARGLTGADDGRIGVDAAPIGPAAPRFWAAFAAYGPR